MSNMLKRILVMLLVLMSVFTITSCEEDDGVDPIKFSFFLDEFDVDSDNGDYGFGDGSGYDDHAQAGSPYHSVKKQTTKASSLSYDDEKAAYVPYYTYDGTIEYNNDGLSTKYTGIYTGEFNESNTSETEYDGNKGTTTIINDGLITGKTDFTLNDDNKTLTETDYVSNDNGVSYIIEEEKTYEYNSDGRLSKKTVNEYHTDADASENQNVGDKKYVTTTTYEYFKKDLPLKYVNVKDYYYENTLASTITTEANYVNDGKIITAYNWQQKSSTSADVDTTSYTFTYDADGNVVTDQRVSGSGATTTTYTTTYKWKDGLITELVESQQDSDAAAPTETYKLVKTYDSKGRDLTYTTYQRNNGSMQTTPGYTSENTYE